MKPGSNKAAVDTPESGEQRHPDTVRLDWLEKIGFSTIQNGRVERYPGVHSWHPNPDEWSWTAHWVRSDFATARAAIDAAMTMQSRLTGVHEWLNHAFDKPGIIGSFAAQNHRGGSVGMARSNDAVMHDLMRLNFKLEGRVKALEEELKTSRDIWSGDYKKAMDRVLTLEIENQQLKRDYKSQVKVLREAATRFLLATPIGFHEPYERDEYFEARSELRAALSSVPQSGKTTPWREYVESLSKEEYEDSKGETMTDTERIAELEKRTTRMEEVLKSLIDDWLYPKLGVGHDELMKKLREGKEDTADTQKGDGR